MQHQCSNNVVPIQSQYNAHVTKVVPLSCRCSTCVVPKWYRRTAKIPPTSDPKATSSEQNARRPSLRTSRRSRATPRSTATARPPAHFHTSGRAENPPDRRTRALTRAGTKALPKLNDERRSRLAHQCRARRLHRVEARSAPATVWCALGGAPQVGTSPRLSILGIVRGRPGVRSARARTENGRATLGFGRYQPHLCPGSCFGH